LGLLLSHTIAISVFRASPKVGFSDLVSFAEMRACLDTVASLRVLNCEGL